MGFEYDLAKEFAGRQGVRLEMVVPPAWASVVSGCAWRLRHQAGSGAPHPFIAIVMTPFPSS